MSAQTKEKVATEGAEIYCEALGQWSSFAVDHRSGERRRLLFLAADILSDEFTVVSYDRRCNSRDRN